MIRLEVRTCGIRFGILANNGRHIGVDPMLAIFLEIKNVHVTSSVSKPWIMAVKVILSH